MALLYLGVSLPNQQVHPLGDRIHFCTPDELTDVKVSHDEYALLLDFIKSFDYVEEVALISTCNRFEAIVFLKDEYLNNYYINELKRAIASINKSNVDLGVLVNEEARLQILRTYCGLNSGLVGEDEICLQFEIAFKQCHHMDYLREQGMQLYQEACDLRSLLDREVYQSHVSYCGIAIAQALAKFAKPDFDKVVVFGSGSTAHQSCLAMVKLDYDPNNITLLHRISSSSNQISDIKASKELDGMDYVRTKHGYHADRTRDTIVDADLLIFGIDSRRPVLSFSKNFKTRIIDFNSKPSCEFEAGADLGQYIASTELDSFVRAYSRSRANDPEFLMQLEQAEAILTRSTRVLEPA